MGLLKFIHTFFGLVGFNRPFQRAFIFFLIRCCLTVDFRAPPIIPNVPFVWAWNAPTELCVGKFDQPLDMSLFSLVGSPREGKTGQGVTIFYADRLGCYPFIGAGDAKRSGGIPQLGNLQKHLKKATTDILHYIPTDNVGLAVIDWEEWRPSWIRNWKPKDIYRNLSIELVQKQNPQINLTEATKRAKEEFEKAGKNFMLETLKLGKALRPNHLWGYYLFPDCYNHDYASPNYKGSCPDVEKQRNNYIDWLWNASTALYPSIYLNTKLQSSPKAALYVRNRVHEAIRVSQTPSPQNPLPIFVYARLVFTDVTSQFLSQDDLVNTIGETVALGVSGIVIWGTLGLARSMRYCLILDDYLKNVLNPYLINVTLAAKMCSQALCKEQGVCTRRQWDSSDYLHLNPANFAIRLEKDGKYKVHGKITLKDLQQFSNTFHCSCYSNLNCKERTDMRNVEIINVCATEDVCINSPVSRDAGIEPTLEIKDVPSVSNTTSIKSSTTLSPGVPRKYITGCLLVLSMYYRYLKYLQ